MAIEFGRPWSELTKDTPHASFWVQKLYEEIGFRETPGKTVCYSCSKLKKLRYIEKRRYYKKFLGEYHGKKFCESCAGEMEMWIQRFMKAVFNKVQVEKSKARMKKSDVEVALKLLNE